MFAFLKVLTYKNVFVPVVRAELGARAAGAVLVNAVCYLNVRVRADIERSYSPYLKKCLESFRSPEPFFKRVLGNNPQHKLTLKLNYRQPDWNCNTRKEVREECESCTCFAVLTDKLRENDRVKSRWH